MMLLAVSANVPNPQTINASGAPRIWRLTLIDLAQNSATGRHIMIEESDIAAEVRAPQVDHPDSNICREHRQKLAELEGAAA